MSKIIGNKTLKFNKFHMTDMKKNPCILIYGKRGTGKSFLARDIIYHMKDIPKCIVISKTESLNEFYGKFVNSLFIYDKLTPELLHKVLRTQKKLIIKAKKRQQQNGKQMDIRLLLVLDDVLSELMEMKKDHIMTEIFCNGRHYGLTVILLIQYVKGIPPVIRTNTDYIFLLKEDNTNVLKNYYDMYCGRIEHLQEFVKIFDYLTRDRGAMVVVNAINEAKENDNYGITNKMFWYKASERHFRLGSNHFNKYHDINYDENWYEKKVKLELKKEKNSFYNKKSKQIFFIEKNS